MDDNATINISFWIAAVLTWVIVMMVLVQLSRFLSKFNDGRRDFEANILSIAAQLKSMQTSMTEMIAEQKRVSRLTIEQLELQKAEMTGDFDIVEEPIPTLPESKLGGNAGGIGSGPGGMKFPELKL